MVKKTDEFELDDFEFDKELDAPDFDFEPTKVKDDRNPASKIATSFAQGAKDTVLSDAFARRMVKDALPRGYGSALDLADQSATTLRQLYNAAAQEIKPVVKDVKRATNRVLPMAESILPRKVTDKLREWSKDDPKQGQLTAEQQRDASVNMQLAEIFKLQTEVDQKQRNEDQARDNIGEQMTQKRHMDQLGQLNQIRIGMARLTQYQDRVTVNFQRKSLELQLRHYFVAMDALEEQKKQNAVVTSNLEAITKNTALPEYVKLNNSERFGEMLRNKFMGGVQESIFDMRRGFMRKFGQNLVNNTKQRVGAFAGQVKEGLQMAETIAELQEMQREMGIEQSPGQMAGNMAGGMVADTIGRKIGSFIGKPLRKNEKVRRVGNELQYVTENLPQIGWDWAQSDKGNDIPILGPIIRLLKESAGNGNLDLGLQGDNAEEMMGPAIFNNQTRKSITEVIPGFLSRIYQELQIIRTGDEKIQAVSYDYDANKFSVGSKLRGKNFGKMFNKDDVEASLKEAEELVEQVSKGSNLSAEQKKVLAQTLIRKNFANELASPERLSDIDSWNGASGRYGADYADLFEKYFADDKDKSRKQQFAKEFNKLGSRVGDPRARMQMLLNLGQYDVLRDMGLIGEEDVGVNRGKFDDYRTGNSYGAGESLSDIITGRKTRYDPLRPKGSQKLSRKHRQELPDQLPGQQAQSIQIDTGALATTLGDKLGSVLKEESVKTESQTIIELLGQMKDRMDKVFAVYVVGSADGPAPDGMPEGPGGGPNKPWYLWNIGDISSKIGSASRWAFGKANKFKDDTINRANSLRKGAWEGMQKLWGRGKDKFDEWNEVYIKGELLPRLTAAKLRAGKYKDSVTGEILESFEGIKNAIIDVDTGEIVLKPEEMKNAFLKSKVGKKMVSLWDKVGPQLKSLLSKIQAPIPMAINAGMDMARKAFGQLDKPVDIYLKDAEQPIMLAITMKAGGYFSALTGQPILKPSQIDGAVKDKEGNFVVTDDQVKGGLFTRSFTGRLVPLKTGLAKIGAMATDFVMGGINKLRGMAGWAGKKISAAWKGTRDFFGGMVGSLFGEEGVVFAGSKRMVDTLTEIRDILDARLPGGKPRVLGDADGDGVREGSYEDLKKKKSETLKDKLAAAKDAAMLKGQSIYGMGAEGLRGLWEKLRGKKGGEDEEEEDDGGINVDLGDRYGGDGDGDSKKSRRERARERLRRRQARRVPKGAWNKIKHYGGRGLRGLGRGAGSLLRGAGGLLLGEGAMGAASMLGRGALMAGGAALSGAGALASGAATLGSAALTGIGAIGAGIASVLTAPVILGALAVAAVGVGGYFAYKYFTRKKLEPLSTVRYAQYGFLKDETDYLEKVFKMEDSIKSLVTWKDGIAELADGKVNYKDLAKDVDIDIKDYEQTQAWLTWFATRFKPVYLTNLTALKKTAPEVDLADVDEKLTPEQKKAFLNIAKWPDGPYASMTNPYDKTKNLTAGQTEVNHAADAALQAIDEEAKKKPSENKIAGGRTAALGLTALNADAEAKRKADAEKSEVERKQSEQQFVKVGQGIQAAMAGKAANDARNVATVVGAPIPQDRLSGSRLDALTCVRYKTYGLKELDIDKVRALDAFELEMAKYISYNGDDTAQWMGSMDKMLRKFGPVFGVDGVANNYAYDWMNWFNQRFLPTFLNFATSVYRNTKKSTIEDGLKSMLPLQFVDVAQVIYTSQANTQDGIKSVWQIMASPWPNYVLNSDPRTTDVNVKALKEAAKQKTFDETVGKEDPAVVAKRNAELAAKVTSRFDDKRSIDFSKNPSMLMSTVNQGRENMNKYSAAQWMYTGSQGGASPYQTGAGYSGGVAIQHPGNGTGGDINKLPQPKGNGSWEAVKDIILGAAQMAGVDPMLMASMAAIESGFKWDVKAGSSSATGLYQFISGTWSSMLEKYGAKYGIAPGTPATDPRANALMGAEFLKMNANELKSLGRPLTDTDLYMAHFLGAGGARKFLSAAPGTIGAFLMPDAARSNPSIFYDGGRARTTGEIYALMSNKLRTRAGQYGIKASDMQGSGQAAPAAPETPGSTSASTSGTPAVPPLLAASQNPAATTSAPTPEATTPSASASAPTSPIGVMAMPNNPASVAKQAAPVGVMAAAPAAAPTASQDSTPLVATQPAIPDTPPPPTGQAFGGFQPINTASIDAQQQYQQEQSSSSIGVVDETLKKSLGVQTESRELLKLILGEIRSQGNAANDVVRGLEQQNQQRGGPTRSELEKGTQAPVSMKRQY